MAIITNGFLISMRKSAAGFNFYKRRGEQVMRSKPTLPAGYEPSARQSFIRSVFSHVSALTSSMFDFDTNIKANYMLRGKNRPKTPKSLAIGKMAGRFFIGLNGNQWSAAIQNALFNAEMANPGQLANVYRPFSFQRGSGNPDGYSVSRQAQNLTIKVSDVAWKAWCAKLTRLGFRLSANPEPFVIWACSGSLATAPLPFYPSDMTLKSGEWSVTIALNILVIVGKQYQAYQWAFGAPLDPNYYGGGDYIFATGVPFQVETYL